MLPLIGLLGAFFCVFGAFGIHGGNLMVLWQPIELVIIFGTGAMTVLVSCPTPLIKDMGAQLGGIFKGHSTTKEEYLQVLLCIFELFKLGKGNMLALEEHVENPGKSDIFKKYPSVLDNHHLLAFITDTLRVQISSPVSPYDLDELMDQDLKSAHELEAKAPAAVNVVADGMPGLGIVAAVLGVVNTMGKLSEGKEVIGNSVAAALVGTFLGILGSYGFVGPMASRMVENLANHHKIFDVVKQGLLAFAKDISPKVCIEFARRTVPPDVRPEFSEVDKATSNIKGKAA